MMLKDLIQDFHLSLFQKLRSLTHETRIKDAVNMEDLTCLFATVRTLKMVHANTKNAKSRVRHSHSHSHVSYTTHFSAL